MESATAEPVSALRDKLDDPKVAEALTRLLDRAEDLERVASTVADASKAIPDIVATGADVVDEACRKASGAGVNLEERLQSLISVLLRLTDPNTIVAIERLIDRLPQLEEASRMLDEIPNLVAIVADVFEDYAKQLKEQGIDLETSISHGLHAALWFGQRVSEVEIDRLGYLLRSDVLDPHALDVVGNAATSLATCQRDSCEEQTSERIGVLGLMQALRDPNVQRSLGFAVRFAKCFGSHANSSTNGKA